LRWALVLTAAAIWGWVGLFVWGLLPASSAVLPPRRVSLRGSERQAAAQTLGAAGLIDSPHLMAAYWALVAPAAAISARDHWLGGGRSPRQLVATLADRGGPVSRVVLPEGGSSFELGERLARAGVCDSGAFLEAARDRRLLDEHRVPGDGVEGYLFPESHEFRQDERPERVLARFLAEGRRRLAAIEERYPLLDEHRTLGLGFREVVILASIVEKETARPAERPRIARVFLNRLGNRTGETGGRLESDPTSVYGCRALGALAPASCTQVQAGVSPALIKDEQNPYGTYRRAGLPPGPIGNPGEAALVAVLRPASGDELYFVADGQGNHSFSRTFAEHRAAVQRLKALRRPASP